MRWILSLFIAVAAVVLLIPGMVFSEDSLPPSLLKLHAIGGVTPGDSTEIYLVARPQNRGNGNRIPGDQVVFTYTVINHGPSSCRQTFDFDVALGPGINVLRPQIVMDPSGRLRVDLRNGDDSVELDPCFDYASRLTAALSQRVGRDSDRRGPSPLVVGGYVVGEDGESKAAIYWGDFDGPTVMYLDVTETN